MNTDTLRTSGRTWILQTGGLFICSLATISIGAEPNVVGLKSFGTSGKAVYPFTEGSKTEAVLYEHEGAGCLTHMWFGGNWTDWEEMRIRVYVDGEEKASIDLSVP